MTFTSVKTHCELDGTDTTTGSVAAGSLAMPFIGPNQGIMSPQIINQTTTHSCGTAILVHGLGQTREYWTNGYTPGNQGFEVAQWLRGQGWQTMAIAQLGDYITDRFANSHTTFSVDQPNLYNNELGADPGHGTRWVLRNLAYWDHLKQYLWAHNGDQRPIILIGSSLGAWFTAHILANRWTDLTWAAMNKPVTLMRYVNSGSLAVSDFWKAPVPSGGDLPSNYFVKVGIPFLLMCANGKFQQIVGGYGSLGADAVAGTAINHLYFASSYSGDTISDGDVLTLDDTYNRRGQILVANLNGGTFSSGTSLPIVADQNGAPFVPYYSFAVSPGVNLATGGDPVVGWSAIYGLNDACSGAGFITFTHHDANGSGGEGHGLTDTEVADIETYCPTLPQTY